MERVHNMKNSSYNETITMIPNKPHSPQKSKAYVSGAPLPFFLLEVDTVFVILYMKTAMKISV